MPNHPERELARLRARIAERSQDLTQIGFRLKGTLLQRAKQCGSAGCRCKADPPQLHGPYWQWTSKVKGKTVTRLLKKEEEVERYQEWIENARRFEEIAQELQALSDQADLILRATPSKSARRTKSAS
jgi:hypothetical protein